jgi:hypothetical protein
MSDGNWPDTPVPAACRWLLSSHVVVCARSGRFRTAAPTQIEALQGVEAVVCDVRIGEGLHRQLVVHAAEDGLSLNQYVVKKLASA